LSLRRPSLKSTLYMGLLAGGIILAAVLIFRGTGAPREPARVVVPVDRVVHLETPGRYVVFAELLVTPQPEAVTGLRIPAIDLELKDSAGTPVGIEPVGFGGWGLKFLTKQRGHSMGAFVVERPGEYRVRAELREVAGRRPDVAVVLAFAPAASLGRFLWLLLGFSGQIFFSLRFLVQWLASEKAGRSTVPRSFWYYSLIGGLMVLLYAIYTRDPVFIAAFAFNSFIYVRNLVLLRREDLAAAAEVAEAAGTDGSGPAAQPPAGEG
jgi:lipid-A-disaccharide synthase-like uncharacterized protein